MSIRPQAEDDGHHVVHSFKFKADPNAERFSFEKFNNGEYNERMREIFGNMPVIHIGPSGPNMPLGRALLLTRLQLEAMKEPWEREGYCGELDA